MAEIIDNSPRSILSSEDLNQAITSGDGLPKLQDEVMLTYGTSTLGPLSKDFIKDMVEGAKGAEIAFAEGRTIPARNRSTNA